MSTSKETEPINGGTVNMVLQREVNRVLTAKNWSLIRAEMQTGISSGTINRMKKGLNVASKTVIDFGVKVGEPVTRWEMIAVGRDPDVDNQNVQSTAIPSTVISPEIAAILEYVEDPEVREAVKYFHGVSQEMRPAALAALKGMAGAKPRYKNAQEIAEELEAEATVGSKKRTNPSTE